MDRWSARAAQGGMLVLLFLLPAVLAGTGLAPAARATALAIVPGVTSSDFEEPNGLIAAHTMRAEAALQTVLGELALQKAPLPSGPVTYVPILYYHYIRVNLNPSDRVGFGLSTPPAVFRAQMQYLADHEFHVISLHQAVTAIKNHTKLPSRPVVLTFDDGYADFYTAAMPVLLSHGFTATDFVISGRLGRPGFMPPTQVVAADALGFTIGAHTVDHVALAAQTPAGATWQMRQSKLALEGLLGHPVADFAYPYGSFDAYDMAQAQKLGFETAVSTMSGTLHSAGQLMDLSRLRIGGGLALTSFADMVGGPRPTPTELRV